MSKKFDKKLREIEDWLDHYSDDLDEAGYSVIFNATKRTDNDMNDWYSFTGFPVGLVDAMATMCAMIQDYIGYDNLSNFMDTLTKYASLRENVGTGKTAPEIAQPQHKALCDSIMEIYHQSMSEALANFNPDDAIDELLDEYFDDGYPLEDED